jgi:hypothetical protein
MGIRVRFIASLILRLVWIERIEFGQTYFDMARRSRASRMTRCAQRDVDRVSANLVASTIEDVPETPVVR